MTLRLIRPRKWRHIKQKKKETQKKRKKFYSQVKVPRSKTQPSLVFINPCRHVSRLFWNGHSYSWTYSLWDSSARLLRYRLSFLSGTNGSGVGDYPIRLSTRTPTTYGPTRGTFLFESCRTPGLLLGDWDWTTTSPLSLPKDLLRCTDSILTFLFTLKWSPSFLLYASSLNPFYKVLL